MIGAPVAEDPRSMKVAERLGMKPGPAVELAATDTRGSVEVTPFWPATEDWRATG